MSLLPRPRRTLTIAALAGVLVLPFAALPASAEPAPDADTATINLMNINDFHGRINASKNSAGDPTGTVNFAGTVESLRAQFATDQSILLSAGDNIGASEFASATQKDQPTIEVLNALGLKASALGNHEFDLGLDDLKNRVIDGGNNAAWDYLGANVYRKGTTEPAFDEYSIIQADGLRVAVIGAVTEETPTLVTPSGVDTLEFGDPVDAVNRVVTQLKAENKADVFVAEYHEGASAGTPDGASLDQEIAAGGVFAKIVTQTDPAVAAIFTGHTHKEYAWQAPVPGKPGSTRPIVQTGSYGERIGQVVLTVNRATGAIETATATNVARVKTPTAELIDTYPAVKTVNDIVTAAVANADEVGSRVIAQAAAPITRAFNGPVGDDRSAESSLGSLIANSLLTSLSAPERGGAEIGIVNPGGMRADLAAGDITYAQANGVLPFLNNLYTTSLTGAQVKKVLEEQWQRDAAGNVPSRPYLQLSLSDNVHYTFDANRAEGDRITSITVAGEPIDPTRGYRVGTFGFLITGGDNFREFQNGIGTRDSGLIDRDAWIDYLTTAGTLTPSFARNGVQVSDLPADAVEAGKSFTVTLGSLDRTSTGAPVSTSVLTALGTDVLGSAPITAAGGEVTITIPAGTTAGTHTVSLTSPESKTIVRFPVRVTEAAVVVPTPEPSPTDGTTVPTPEPTDGTTVPTPEPSDGTTVPSGEPSTGTTAPTADGAQPDGLAHTGAQVSAIAPLAALILLLAGAGIFVSSRRKRAAAQAADDARSGPLS
ncbi:LPXTG cell wall anchor domain-containing protein [Mycetocola tolaasinivorans]|uniref:LPXTG cell wall anchor domain-containing protein n=1 Tax=Mycetocola tolaasinivorans TaxID=76635 RepID=A0A3L7A0N2_9MICO|nr:bifunctional UDP-sugar hydrolase/5'-nucleotidase [Mycetocola tolaasinivorans]RLP73201.1 LPXTG cell wall anchor domain-containing protein [Mycetocola tolaasinivorans]